MSTPFSRPPEAQASETATTTLPPAKTTPLPNLLVLTAYDTQFAADLAMRMLAAAEDSRRDGNGSFDPTARGEPSGDWGLAGTIIARASHHLDESVPNGQRDRTSAAMGALLIGVAMLERALSERGVNPARLHHIAPKQED